MEIESPINNDDFLKGIKIEVSARKMQFGEISVSLQPAEYSEESFSLYKKYCIKIH